MTDTILVLGGSTDIIAIETSSNATIIQSVTQNDTSLLEVRGGQPGPGVIPGGLANQSLLKIDETDFNTTWSFVDHNAVLNIGINTHTQIDTHIADSTIHFTEASIDHTNILNIGTNTHAQIDTHIADSTIHFTEADFDMVVPTAAMQINSPTDLFNINRYISHMWSPTVTEGAVITDNLDGTINISQADITIRGGNEHTQLYTARVNATNNIALTDNSQNVVYVDWNAGNPVIAVTTDPTIVDIQTKVPMYLIVREGNALTIVGSLEEGVDSNAKLRKRLFYTEQYKRVDGGSVISETGTNNLACSAGAFYFGLRELTHNAIDTSLAGTFEYYRLIAGAWVETNETQFDNLQYNDISVPGSETLATLGNNKYAVHWVYIIPNDMTTQYAVIYSQDTYNTFANAQSAGVPVTAPPSIATLGQLLGRYIVKKGDTTGVMESVWTETFTSAVPTTHNDLAGLQGGALDQYYHLDATEHTNVLAHLTDTTNPHSVTQAQVGLGNVDNTSDLNKPISTATQTALDLKLSNIVEDATPQLGGDFDCNGFSIITPDVISGPVANINIISGNNSSIIDGDEGGSINITAGYTSADGIGFSRSNGGEVIILSGDNFDIGGNGGNFTLTAGSAKPTIGNGSGGDFTLSAGNAYGAGSAGGFTLKGGSGAVGGTFNITGGDSLASTGTGGHITIVGGTGTGTGTGGKISIVPGKTGTGTPGSIQIETTNGVAGQGALQFWNHTDTTHTTGNQITLKAPAATVDRTWVLPMDDPITSASKILTTNTTGDLSFTDTLTTDIVGTDFVKTRSGTITRTSNLVSQIAKTGGRTLTITRDINNRIATVGDGTRTTTFTRVANKITSWTVA